MADQLVIEQRTSKPREAYHRATRSAAALARADETGLPVSPGQSVEYVVVDDSKRSRERVRLTDEVVPAHWPRRSRLNWLRPRPALSRYYAQRAHYRVRSLNVTALVDVETLYVTDVHCTTTKKHDAKIGPQVAHRNAGDLLSLAADRGYDGKPFRDELRSD